MRTEEQDQFQDFKTLLDKLKGNGRISAEQWREYVGQWQKSPPRPRYIDSTVEVNVRYLVAREL